MLYWCDNNDLSISLVCREANSLRETISKLNDIKKARTLNRSGRELDECEFSDDEAGALECGCLELLSTIKNFIKVSIELVFLEIHVLSPAPNINIARCLL